MPSATRRCFTSPPNEVSGFMAVPWVACRRHVQGQVTAPRGPPALRPSAPHEPDAPAGRFRARTDTGLPGWASTDRKRPLTGPALAKGDSGGGGRESNPPGTFRPPKYAGTPLRDVFGCFATSSGHLDPGTANFGPAVSHGGGDGTRARARVGLTSAVGSGPRGGRRWLFRQPGPRAAQPNGPLFTRRWR